MRYSPIARRRAAVSTASRAPAAAGEDERPGRARGQAGRGLGGRPWEDLGQGEEVAAEGHVPRHGWPPPTCHGAATLHPRRRDPPGRPGKADLLGDVERRKTAQWQKRPASAG